MSRRLDAASTGDAPSRSATVERRLSRRGFLRRCLSTGLAAGLSASGLATAAPLLGFGRHSLPGGDGDSSRRVTVSCHAVDVVLRSTVIDMLGLLTLDWPRLMTWQRTPGRFDEEDFRRLEDSAIGIFHPAVEPGGADPYLSARRWLKGWRHLGRSACYFDPIDEPSKLSWQNRRGQIGILVGFQNSNH